MSCLIIIENGHGVGVKGKCTIMPNGHIFNEWIYTRIIKMNFIQELHERKIPYVDLIESCNDISLRTRVKKEESVFDYSDVLYENTVHISIHGNAFSNKKANGITVFTSMNENQSDIYANDMVECLKPLPFFDRYDIDSEGLKGRDANFMINREFKSYGMTVELGFSTNNKDLALMTDFTTQIEIAKAMADACEMWQ